MIIFFVGQSQHLHFWPTILQLSIGLEELLIVDLELAQLRFVSFHLGWVFLLKVLFECVHHQDQLSPYFELYLAGDRKVIDGIPIESCLVAVRRSTDHPLNR